MSVSTSPEQSAPATVQTAGSPQPAPSSSMQQEAADFARYKSVSILAVASLGMVFLSLAVLLNPFIFSVIPLLGMAMGAIALWRIRKNPDELTGEKFGMLGMSLCGLVLAGVWTQEAYVYATEMPPGYMRLGFGDMRPADITAPFVVPEDVRKLEGQQVFIKGYIRPGSQFEDLTEFLLVRDNGACCYGATEPATWDRVNVHLKDHLATDYSTYLRKIGGKLRIEEVPIGPNEVTYIFHIDGNHVQ